MELVLQDSAGRQLCRVWPEADSPLPGTVQEGREYVFELQPVDLTSPLPRLSLDGAVLRRDIPDTPHCIQWMWPVDFHAGEVELELVLAPGSRHAIRLVVDPDRRKLTRDHFQQMVREILEDTFALLSLSQYRIGVARGTGDRPPIARLEFLSARLQAIEHAVRAIANQPVSILRAEERLQPPHRSLPLTTRELLRSFPGNRLAREPAVGDSRLPSAMGGIFPTVIRKSVRTVGVDIREHRDIKYALRTWATWLAAVADRLEAPLKEDAERQAQAHRWALRCRGMARRLSALLRLPFFSEIGDTGGALQLSQVFRRNPRYRRFFTLYRDFQAGIASVLGEFLNVPLARTFELYERWAFLRLARAAAELFPAASIDTTELFTATDGGGVSIPCTAVRIRIEDHVALCFQRTYREYWLEPDGLGSYSREMRPDVSVETAGNGSVPLRLIVLDAKYRVHEQLNAAVAAIHMYRDAIVHADQGGERGVVTGAYILTPHLPHLDHSWQKTEMPGRLFHPEYRGHFRFGAVCLLPGMPAQDVRHALQTILADSRG